MDKFEVIVQQEVGAISWNFDQLKTALAEKLSEYEAMVYTDETVTTAKADVAELRKLKKAVADKRIEIKKKCLEPYDIIEKQANELTALLDAPINKIAAQLDEYETKRRQAIKEKITEYMNTRFMNMPDDIAAKLKIKTYDSKWENATATQKAWKQAIDDAATKTADELKLIDDLEDELKDAAMKAYAIDLSITDAMTKANEFRQIFAKEREKIAEQERVKAEIEARAQIEAEQRKAQTYAPNEQEHVKTAPDDVEARIVKVTHENAGNASNFAFSDDTTQIYTLRIKATDAQIAKIKGYIEYCGAVYREA